MDDELTEGVGDGPDAVDVTVLGAGSLVQLFLNTPAARAWVKENVDAPGYLWLGADSLCVEPRYVEAIVNGMVEAGLEVA